MNLASLARRPQTTSPFLPSAPLFPPSRRHHQSPKMASVTAYIEEKDLAAKVRNNEALSERRRREKKSGADAASRSKQTSAAEAKRESRKERSNFSGAPCASLLGSRRPPLAHFDRDNQDAWRAAQRGTRNARNAGEKKQTVFLLLFFFALRSNNVAAFSFWKGKRVLFRAPLCSHTLFSQNHPFRP